MFRKWLGLLTRFLDDVHAIRLQLEAFRQPPDPRKPIPPSWKSK